MDGGRIGERNEEGGGGMLREELPGPPEEDQEREFVKFWGKKKREATIFRLKRGGNGGQRPRGRKAESAGE